MPENWCLAPSFPQGGSSQRRSPPPRRLVAASFERQNCGGSKNVGRVPLLMPVVFIEESICMSASNLEILAYEETPLGMLCLRRRELLNEPGTMVTEVTLNDEFLMSSYHTDSERALASQALEIVKGRDLQVLVGGLGLGYTAAEVLASDRVAHVEVVEFLPQVIDWLDQGLTPLADSLKGDARMSVSHGDVYKLLTEPPRKQYDVILIDVDHSPDDKLDGANAVFYQEKGLKAAQKHVAKDGVLGVWSYAESSPFANALKNVFGDVLIKPVTFTNTLIDDRSFTDWLFFARA